MTPNQPYLLKAFFDWIVDNQLTPYMVVNADYPNVTIPRQFVNDGQIVLNVSPTACVNFHMDVDTVQFQARFSGQPMLVSFPCAAVTAIYARENGAGTVFTEPELSPDAWGQNEASSTSSENSENSKSSASEGEKPSRKLSLASSQGDSLSESNQDAPSSSERQTSASSDSESGADVDSDQPDDDDPNKPKGSKSRKKPGLRIVK